MLLDCSTRWPGFAYSPLSHSQGGMRSKHLSKGMFQVHFFLWWPFTHSGWWHVVQIVPTSIIPIALIITPPLALILF